MQRRKSTRVLLRSAVESYTLKHATEITARDRAVQSGDKRKAEVVPPLAIEVTVGIGKSRSVSQTIVPMIYGADMPILILTPTRALCDEYAAAIRASGIPCTVYRPRQETRSGEPSTPFSCYQIKQIDKAGSRHQRPAQSICRQCPSGHKAAMDKGVEARERAIRFFSRSGYAQDQIQSTPPCRYLYEGLPDQLKAEVLIAPAAAFSDALATVKRWHVDSDGRDKEIPMQRLIIVDERIPMTETIHLSVPHIDGWMTAISHSLDSIIDEKRPALMQALMQVQTALGALGARLLQRQTIDSDTRDMIQRAYRAVSDADLIDGGTASFERVSFMPDDQDFFIPLRAFAALARAMRHITDEVEGSTVRIGVPKPLIDWMIKRGSTIVLDATLDPTLRDLIKGKGGEIISAQTPQHIRVTRVEGRMWARGAIESQRYGAEAARAMKHLAAIAATMPRPAAIITHKSYLLYSSDKRDADAVAKAFEADTGVAIGWYGKHDRGHNRWAGRHIALVGMPILSPSTIRSLWQERRVLMRLIGQEIEPLSISDGSFIPDTPEAARWLMDIYAATLVQAIGRARGVNHDADDPLQIRLYGGLVNVAMDAALWRHLVPIDATERYSDSIQVPRADDPRWRIRAAIEGIARGRKGAAGVSQRAVETWMMRTGQRAGRHSIVLDEIKKWKLEQNQ